MPAAQADSSQAFVTLATNDTYALGALVLAYSLRRAETNKNLVVLITKDLSCSVRGQLHEAFHEVVEVDVFDSRDCGNLELLGRPDLGVTFTKLHCWKLVQYTKCVFMDADTLVLQNIDELFEREEMSASPDPGWPDCFNSGVFVFRPSIDTYNSLVQFALQSGSFDGGDQGLLNMYFNSWATEDIKKHLPFTYNVVSMAFYSYLPAMKQFGQNVKVVHFIGERKPWNHQVDSTGKVVPEEGTGHNVNFLQLWWNIFLAHVAKGLHSEMTGFAGKLANLEVSAPFGIFEGASECKDEGEGSCDRSATDEERYQAWSKGQVDYLGQDAFHNIASKLESAVRERSCEYEEHKEVVIRPSMNVAVVCVNEKPGCASIPVAKPDPCMASKSETICTVNDDDLAKKSKPTKNCKAPQVSGHVSSSSSVTNGTGDKCKEHKPDVSYPQAKKFPTDARKKAEGGKPEKVLKSAVPSSSLYSSKNLTGKPEMQEPCKTTTTEKSEEPKGKPKGRSFFSKKR